MLLAASLAAATQDQTAPGAASLRPIKAFTCPQTNYQQALAGTPDLQSRAAQAQATGINDPSCTQHEPTSPAGQALYKFLSNTGTDRTSTRYDALCPQGRHLWLKQEPNTFRTTWEPCLPALAAAPGSVLPPAASSGAKNAASEIDCRAPLPADAGKCRMVGVWMTDSYYAAQGITITAVRDDGELVGCFWGWYSVKWHKAENSIGDPATYNTANWFLLKFGETIDGRFDGTTVRMTIPTGGNNWVLTVSGDVLRGTYISPSDPSKNSNPVYHRTDQRATNCASK